MNVKSLWDTTRKEAKSFFAEVKAGPQGPYLALFVLYITIYFLRKMNWDDEIWMGFAYIQVLVLSIVLWGGTIYLIYLIVKWKKLIDKPQWLLAVAAPLIVLMVYASNHLSTDGFNLVLDLYFCLMAYGKDYKKIIRCTMIVALTTLVIAAVGDVVGFTHERPKPYEMKIGYDFSFGIIYPNTWGYIMFLAMMTGWYLYLQKKRLVTFVLFWCMSVFMFFIVNCRTIALLTFLFPVATLLPEMLQARSEAGLQTKPRSKAACVLFTAAPVLAFALTVFLCYEMEWLVAHLSRYGLGTFVARFEQGGISFQYYGFPLIGHPILTDGSIKATLNGSVHSLTVMDNTFASYAIMRGMIWMVWCLAWLCLANWRAYKRRDYRLLLLSIIILIFGLMERPGLDVWYNFMLLYPLAAIVELPKKKKSAAVGKKTAKKGKSK